MMTLNELTFALFKGNIRKYRLFVISNVLAVGMLLSLQLLLENPYLNNPEIVDPMISSNVFAPTLFMYVFVGFFIPYATILLNRQIQKNYGILLALGMAKNQYVKCVLLENILMMLLSIIGGMVTGTILEYFLTVCVCIILKFPDYNHLFVLSKGAYTKTILFTIAVYLIVLLTIFFRNNRNSILNLIMEERKSEQKGDHKLSFWLGGLLFWLSIITYYLFCEVTEGNALLFGMFFSFLGLSIMWCSIDWIVNKWRRKKLFLISDYLYYSKSNAKFGIILTAIFGAFIFVNAIATVSGRSLKQDVINYYPYDLVYSLEEGKDEEKLLNDFGVSVEEQEKQVYFYANGYAVLGAEDVNMQTHSTFQVPEGKYLFVRSVVLNDGYAHERGFVPEQLEIGGQIFALFDDIDQLLFCRGGGLTDSLIIMNQEDYDSICGTMNYRQVLHMCKIKENVDQNGLAEYVEKITCSNVASFYEAYERAEKSAGLLHFLIGYVSVIFLISTALAINYKKETEHSKDKVTCQILLLCGAEDSFLTRCRREKWFYCIFIPFIIAVIWMSILLFCMKM